MSKVVCYVVHSLYISWIREHARKGKKYFWSVTNFALMARDCPKNAMLKCPSFKFIKLKIIFLSVFRCQKLFVSFGFITKTQCFYKVISIQSQCVVRAKQLWKKFFFENFEKNIFSSLKFSVGPSYPKLFKF